MHVASMNIDRDMSMYIISSHIGDWRESARRSIQSAQSCL